MRILDRENRMRPCPIIAGIVIMGSAALAAPAEPAAGAAEAFARGTERLRNGDAEGALREYASAARADPEDERYRQEYLLLRRVIKMREALAVEADPQTWRETALALLNFYYQRGLHREVRSLAERLHQRSNSPSSAVMLADAHLALREDGAAERVLAAQDPKALPVEGRLLLGIARARQGKLDEAKALLAGTALPPGAGPRVRFDRARLEILCEDGGAALRTLGLAFESTAPSRLDAFKPFAKAHPDFASVAGTKAFARVLKTPSKVPESPCSGGPTCATCPKRGGCPSAGCPSSGPAAGSK